MNIDFVFLLIFVIILSAFLYINKKNLILQKVFGPVLYILMYRTSIGLKFMDKVSSKHRELIKFIGIVFVGFAFLGLFWGAWQILVVMGKFFLEPKTTNTGVGLVIPGTSIPGIGYLPFFYWIIAIFITALVHEFAHGVVARAHNVHVSSSGIAFVGIVLPIVPAAFVEPDEKQLMKQDDVVQYSVFAAGPLINISLAIILFMALPYVADLSGSTPAPFETAITEPIGFSVTLTNSTLPAGAAGITNGSIITSFNGMPVTNSTLFLETMYYCVKPGEEITVGTADGTNYPLITAPSPGDASKGIIGVSNIRNERRVKAEYKAMSPAYFWVKDLIKWIFLFNLFIGAANLLPIFMTDGARMLQILFYKLFDKKERAEMAWKYVNMLFFVLLIIGLVGPWAVGIIL